MMPFRFAGMPVLALAVLALTVFAVAPAMAQTASDQAPAFQGLVPPTGLVTYGLQKPDGDDTHPIMKITPDKSELVRLERDAGSVIVGNPDHLGVLMDNRRLLILVPRAPGATYMTVLDPAGEVIMQRHVIVASPKSDYIRIRRSCAGQGEDCQETSVYFCPGMCHAVGIVSTEGSGEIAPVTARPPMAPEAEDSGDTDADLVVEPVVETDAPTR